MTVICNGQSMRWQTTAEEDRRRVQLICGGLAFGLFDYHEELRVWELSDETSDVPSRAMGGRIVGSDLDRLRDLLCYSRGLPAFAKGDEAVAQVGMCPRVAPDDYQIRCEALIRAADAKARWVDPRSQIEIAREIEAYLRGESVPRQEAAGGPDRALLAQAVEAKERAP